MKSYKAAELTAHETYKLLTGSVIPRPIAWLTTINADGQINAAPFSFFNIVSSNPPLVSISMTEIKDSGRNLISTEEAVINLVNSDNVALMNETAAPLDPTISEIAEFNIPLRPSETVKVPTIESVHASLETVLYKHIGIGQNGHLFLLEVVNFVFDDRVIDSNNLHLDPVQLEPIARLAGNTFAKLGQRFDIKRP